jgi:hypothetical protein
VSHATPATNQFNCQHTELGRTPPSAHWQQDSASPGHSWCQGTHGAVTTLLEAGNAYFAATAASSLTWADVATFYSMEASLREGVLQQGPGMPVTDKLRSTFLCLEEAWRDEDLRGAWLDLPLPAVELLAAMDELQVVSENAVATALASRGPQQGGGRPGTAACVTCSCTTLRRPTLAECCSSCQAQESTSQRRS